MGFFSKIGDVGVGAGIGALAGGALGSFLGPGGTALGAKGGAVVGGYIGNKQHNANEDQKSRIGKAKAQLLGLSNDTYARRMADLDKAMAYFQPVGSMLQQRYGQQPPPMPPPVRGRTGVV